MKFSTHSVIRIFTKKQHWRCCRFRNFQDNFSKCYWTIHVLERLRNRGLIMFDLWALQKVRGLPSLQMNEARPYSAIDTKIKGKYNCTKLWKKMKGERGLGGNRRIQPKRKIFKREGEVGSLLLLLLSYHKRECHRTPSACWDPWCSTMDGSRCSWGTDFGSNWSRWPGPWTRYVYGEFVRTRLDTFARYASHWPSLCIRRHDWTSGIQLRLLLEYRKQKLSHESEKIHSCISTEWNIYFHSYHHFQIKLPMFVLTTNVCCSRDSNPEFLNAHARQTFHQL